MSQIVDKSSLEILHSQFQNSSGYSQTRRYITQEVDTIRRLIYGCHNYIGWTKLSSCSPAERCPRYSHSSLFLGKMHRLKNFGDTPKYVKEKRRLSQRHLFTNSDSIVFGIFLIIMKHVNLPRRSTHSITSTIDYISCFCLTLSFWLSLQNCTDLCVS